MSQGGENLLWRGFVDERHVFLSTMPAAPGERRLALAVVIVSSIIFAGLAPYAKTLLGAVPAFLPAYQSALILIELATAVLLFGQCSTLRSRGLLILGSAYVFSAAMAAAHMLSFPGLFFAAGLPGVGSQTVAWLYFIWHAGFPLLVIAYALFDDRRGGPGQRIRNPRAEILAGIGTALALACGFTLLTTLGHDALPVIMQGNRDAPAKVYVATVSWALSVGALPVLWRRQPHSVLDLWLMVVMFVWVFDIALASVLNAGRYDIGWYGGRVYGLLAGSFVLVVLLVETAFLYGRLAAAHAGEFRERRRAQEKAIELSAVNKELEAFGYSVSHDLRAPLRAIDGYSRLLAEDYHERLDDEGRRLLGVVRSSAQRMGRLIDDLLAFSRLGQHPGDASELDMTRLVHEAAAEVKRDFPTAAIAVAELPPAVADRGMLKQVWCNLLGNALKYSARQEQPRVEVGARREPAETVYWVRDNGVGFDMRYAAKLFGVFQRLHTQEEFPGTGVGLAIVQRVITRHRGRVWAEAKPGEGACFYFSLPAEPARA
jgi:signal transduction histidine kinase